MCPYAALIPVSSDALFYAFEHGELQCRERQVAPCKCSVSPPQRQWVRSELLNRLQRCIHPRSITPRIVHHLRILLDNLSRREDRARDQFCCTRRRSVDQRRREEWLVANGRVRIAKYGLYALVGGEERARRGKGGYDDAADSLVDAPKHARVEARIRAIAVEFVVVGAL